MLSIGTYALCSFRVLSREAVRVLIMSKASRERARITVLLGESASSFIGEGDGLTSLERESVCSLVLLPTPSGIR